MKKKELIKELERLKKQIAEQRNDIDILIDGNKFAKAQVKMKYALCDNIEKCMFQGEVGGLHDGFYGLLINTPIQDL